MIRPLILILLITSKVAFTIIFPIFGYSETTGTMVGLFGQTTVDESTDQSIQYLFMTHDNGKNGFIKGTNLNVIDTVYNIEIFGSNTGESYYGINSYNTNTATEIFSNILSLYIETESNISESLHLILGLKLNKYQEIESKNDTRYFNDLNEFGGTIGIQLDTRNKEINSTSGYLNEIKLDLFSQYQIIVHDLRVFSQILSGTFAYKLYWAQTLSNVEHINYYQAVGNYYYMRGYTNNLYVDKYLIFSQFEWRKKVKTWLELTPFIEFGSIGDSIIDLKKTLFSYGLAMHIPVGQSTLRVEKAFTITNTEFYFGFNHVF